MSKFNITKDHYKAFKESLKEKATDSIEDSIEAARSTIQEKFSSLKNKEEGKGQEKSSPETSLSKDDILCIASMLLKYAVLEKNTDIEKSLLALEADPRRGSDNESALLCALDAEDFSTLKVLSKNFKGSPIKIQKSDYELIGSIHNIVAGDHDYSTEDLLNVLGAFYNNIEEVCLI